MMPWIRTIKRPDFDTLPKLVKPYCDCYETPGPALPPGTYSACLCGEREEDELEWHWEPPTDLETSLVLMSGDYRQVTFHPYYSSGTAMVRGNKPFEFDNHYYWEIKMLTEPYGTDIMIGLGTDKVDKTGSRFRFTSLLGEDTESYGFSYSGNFRHEGKVVRNGGGFVKGTIVGIKLDLWQGCAEFFVNREAAGISFFNLRRHPNKSLYPMMCSTAAQSTMRLIYTGSWQDSLLVTAAKAFGNTGQTGEELPPGLKAIVTKNFWMCLPKYDENDARNKLKEIQRLETNYVFPNEIPITFNEYYTDSVPHNYRVALIVNEVDHSMEF